MYDILVVGAGISGATIAREFAEKENKKVLVIDKRNHIGGNCFDFHDDAGILVPQYGPHFFHTSDKSVWEYVSRFTEWHSYEHRVLSRVDESTYVPVPVNITTVNRLFHTTITSEQEMKEFLLTIQQPIDNPQNSEESALSRVGKVLYDKIFKNYTKKQWDMWPSELDASVMNRIPVRMNNDDRYFTDTHQAMPKDGYTKIFENILNHPNITVTLNVSFSEYEEKLEDFEKIFFTGRIDSFFKDKINESLQYRSLRFGFETLDTEFFQTHAQINYPNHQAFTRITEPKHATGQKSDKTTIIKEYSTWEGEPYYPVPNPKNQEIYAKYQEAAQELEKKGIYFLGRLAQYKYFNMDQAFKNALDFFERTR